MVQWLKEQQQLVLCLLLLLLWLQVLQGEE